ncbi:MAG: UDP-3-O-(3-hydroxymyristoyl)glucosamine N-acyltransferase [Armatimonadetes bacterium]|nr:UDP-3-O-(3-hydroxymyristoyl)glucosamine N-acyltransferase [Armatimonadota bacterium]
MAQSVTPRVYTLGELAERLQGIVDGDPDLPITSATGVEDARPGSLVRADDGRYREAALRGPGAALLLDLDADPVDKPAIRVRNPRLAFARLLELFAPADRPPPGIHPTAVVAEGVEIGDGCAVLPYAVLSSGVRLGKNVVIHAHCVLGEGASIGDDSTLFPHVVLYPGVQVGKRVRVHAGVILGADGFSYVWEEGHRKVPQVGGVVIGDEVEIGANTCIDRATTGVTQVGQDTKIDNLVQVGHNARIGEQCLIVGQVGLGGSARVGDRAVLGGQVGVKDHAHIGAGAQVAAKSGVWGNIPPCQVVSGDPARPHRERVRALAAAGKLPEALRTLARLEQRVAKLEQRLAEPGTPEDRAKAQRRQEEPETRHTG